MSGVSVPVHEKPIEPGSQPLTVESGAQVVVVPRSAQQYSVEPALPATPSLQLNEESAWSGVSPPVQEYPVAPPQPVTVESGAHDEGPGVSSGGFGVAVTLQPETLIRSNNEALQIPALTFMGTLMASIVARLGTPRP